MRHTPHPAFASTDIGPSCPSQPCSTPQYGEPVKDGEGVWGYAIQGRSVVARCASCGHTETIGPMMRWIHSPVADLRTFHALNR